jgi:hypothetical protein
LPTIIITNGSKGGNHTKSRKFHKQINKISNWAKDNKITFNEQESKVTVVTMKKRRENKDISIYLNNKPLEQVNIIIYL